MAALRLSTANGTAADAKSKVMLQIQCKALEEKRDLRKDRLERLQKEKEYLLKIRQVIMANLGNAKGKSIPKVKVVTQGGREALNKLKEVCMAEQLDTDRNGDSAFDGPSLLLLSREKLEVWEMRAGRGRKDCKDRLARIRAAAGPLRMPHADSPDSNGSSNDTPSPSALDAEPYFVERRQVHALALKNVLKWEEGKAKPSGRVLAESNILTCNGPRETGSTFVAICIASPSGKDLEALGPLLWEAFRTAAEEQLGLEVSIPDGQHFNRPMEVLEAIQELLGRRMQLMLHVDQAQELAEHAKVGGWYADLVDEFQRILSSREHRGDRAVARELAGTYGLWNDPSELFRKPGVCGFFTGILEPLAKRRRVL
ncbi:g7643 [Coccomyxa viridis]|uniref:G7643 protein n=1 Tax=Coccomyxa viridis TaxID=1274662 RepID=A0ABP1G0Y7_9CHLO